jgi:hypothetical protein
VDANGRAYAGSQRWIQYYVNWRAADLDHAIREAIPEIGAIEWVSPLAADTFAEYRDGEFLARLGLGHLKKDLRGFWPDGGPCWDALAVVDGGSGVVLVEAKSYPAEVYGGGTGAGERSLARITESLEAARRWLNGSPCDWRGLYQSANRLAHLYFLRERAQVPAWLVNVCFVGDPHSPTTLTDWNAALPQFTREMGLAGAPIPYTANVFIESAELR